MNGTHSRSTAHDDAGLGAEHTHRQEFVVEADHPELFAAEDNGATPVEIVLTALGGCLTGGVASVAARRGVRLRSVHATIEAAQDLQGILGIPTCATGSAPSGCAT
ncbi:OsmC family protein [Pseudonocardia sp. RS010]|uniref:OsmC family protein n=1 Tax=Pseudonocardia sp. RS010 TaxID=3385979 RepID=UPI0039A06617